MTELAIKFKERLAAGRLVEGWNTLRGTHRIGLLARVENAFVAWQAARLTSLSPERLWAPAMQDTRSFAEMRLARRLDKR